MIDLRQGEKTTTGEKTDEMTITGLMTGQSVVDHPLKKPYETIGTNTEGSPNAITEK